MLRVPKRIMSHHVGPWLLLQFLLEHCRSVSVVFWMFWINEMVTMADHGDNAPQDSRSIFSFTTDLS